MANRLNALKYKIISREEKFIPRVWATLNDSDIDKAEALYSKLEVLDEVYKISDNIA